MTQQLKHSKQLKQARDATSRGTSRPEASPIAPSEDLNKEGQPSLSNSAVSHEEPLKLPKGTRIRW